ncbi:nucleoporin Ndc1 [Drosophila bipectinata]|uniref:nucleoporin Ndc1 n=1 Tax=Drosophila bipectinata TaxID=42026 RepID=UPI001C8AB587|nr:nucleoporin Ndc1 [Drosophila bipectinata]
MSSSNACKMLLLGRCLHAVLMSAAIQFQLLLVFLLLVNFQLLRPLDWVSGTVGLICSWYTWFASIPLLAAVVLYGVALCQQHLVERPYCPTRYRWILHYGPRKLFFLGAHLLVGFLTAWLYTGYLQTDYRHLSYKCYGEDCISGYHVYMLGMGLTAGCYYFVSVHKRQEDSIKFPIVEQTRGEKLRELIYATLARSLVRSVVPTLSYTVVFSILGRLVCLKLSHILGVNMDERMEGFFGVVTNVKLLFYGWLLTAQILSNMHLMRSFYGILLCEDLPLVITKQKAAFANEQEISLVSALGILNVYIVQCLAANFFYKLAMRKDSKLRAEIFQLTEPGNRPANWRALCDQCLVILGSFTDELIESMQKISVLKGSQNLPLPQTIDSTSTSLMAERILLRQYNQMHGIRPIASPTRNAAFDQPADGIRHMPNWCERVSTQLEESVHRLVNRIPGIVFLFSEPEGSKTNFLLSNSQHVVYITQALSQICVASINEDRYGVVQNDLPAIIKVINKLRGELDKLNSVMGNLRAPSSEFNVLRSAVRRSLYTICNSFFDYLGDLLPPGEELHQLQAFIQQE